MDTFPNKLRSQHVTNGLVTFWPPPHEAIRRSSVRHVPFRHGEKPIFLALSDFLFYVE